VWGDHPATSVAVTLGGHLTERKGKRRPGRAVAVIATARRRTRHVVRS
jgi:hypothetical protein